MNPTKTEAIAAWNRRAPVAVNAELLATLKLVRMYCPVHVQDGIDKLTARAEGRQP